MANKPKKNYKPGKQDVMQTPKHALEPLIPLLPRDAVILEPAHGPEQLLVKALREHGFYVIARDIISGDDYFDGTKEHYDIEVTNPPWSIKYLWLEEAFKRGKPFAHLVPYETTASASFRRLADRYHNKPWPIHKLEPERRISFKTPNYGWGKLVWDEQQGKFVKRGSAAQMPVCWLLWGIDASKLYTSAGYDTFAIPMRSVKYDENNQEIFDK
jgi:hypothetical protein